MTQFTNSEIRAAILKTAELLEQRPHLYDYDEVLVPECGAPGCMMGYIFAHLGFAPGRSAWSDRPKNVMGVYSLQFMHRMDGLVSIHDEVRENAATAARALRLYADKYHPADPLPASIRPIFEAVEA